MRSTTYVQKAIKYAKFFFPVEASNASAELAALEAQNAALTRTLRNLIEMFENAAETHEEMRAIQNANDALEAK